MTKDEIIDLLPNTERGVVVILSGGLDSTTALRLAKEKYSKIHAITFDYGQKQKREISKAKKVCEILKVRHEVIRIPFLNKLSQGFSANVDTKMKMPTIKEVLGDPQPKTMVPNRNMIMLSIAAAYAEVNELEFVICGLQVHDLYAYWDCSKEFVDGLNSSLSLNRKNRIQIIAPFSALSKYDEIKLLETLGDVEILKHTLTCYNPNSKGESCGICPSCAERIQNFAKSGYVDPVPYSVAIPWGKLIQANYMQ